MAHIMSLTEMAFVKDTDELRSSLKGNICEFVYTKKDGSRRTAFGTTNHDLIVAFGGSAPAGADDEATLSRREGLRNAGYISYYDIEKKAWRNCKAYSSEDIDLISSYPTTEEFMEAHPAFVL